LDYYRYNNNSDSINDDVSHRKDFVINNFDKIIAGDKDHLRGGGIKAESKGHIAKYYPNSKEATTNTNRNVKYSGGLEWVIDAGNRSNDNHSIISVINWVILKL
jgi:hypothetical protein